MFAITGLAGSGKDTVGEQLAKELQKETYALANPIKNLIRLLFNIPEHQMNDRQFKELELTYHVDIESLEACGMYYNEIGLGDYLEFHDAWEAWVEIFGLEYGDETYTVQTSQRKLFQLLGTEFGRSLCETLWLDITPDNVIVTDIRFDNEAEYFINKGYTIIEVVRPGMEVIPSSGHASEQGICPTLVGTVLINDGSLVDLYQKVVHLSLYEGPLGVL